MDQSALRDAIARELETNLLPFWRERSLDHRRGGFIAEMASDGSVRDDAPRGLILNARLLWTFSALFRELGDERDLALARRAFEVLEGRFRDREHGGYFWRIDAGGRPLDRSKKTYGQAFALYALAEHFRATSEPAALDAADELVELIDRHAHDHRFGGWIEARAADWSSAADLRLSDKDMDVAKSMNTHLHLLEAFTNLHRARPSGDTAERLTELLTIFDRHILGPDSHHRHLRPFFDEQWGLRSDSYTFGHDIEAAWLLSEAAEVLGDPEAEAATGAWAVELARAVLAQGLDADGGLAYEGRGGAVINHDHDWWCQAEAVVGFWHAFSLTGERTFAEAAAASWRFIDRYFVDRIHGEWFWRVRDDGTVDLAEPKVSEWKCPYHSIRMCLEMTRRLADAGGAAP
jgi:mannobiose 2-epimerase